MGEKAKKDATTMRQPESDKRTGLSEPYSLLKPLAGGPQPPKPVAGSPAPKADKPSSKPGKK